MSDDLTRALVQSADNDAAEESPRTGSRVDDFEIGSEIARGGMGTIYRGRDLELGREVAIKILQDRFPADGSAARRFVEEAQITGQLQHPGIPPIYRAGKLADGRPYLAMKLIKGETLAVRLESKVEPPAKLVAIFESIAQAVGYAHGRGVIHRDLKPANVMVGTYGEVQVMDWGLAKVLTNEHRPVAQDPDTTRGGSEIRSLRDSGEETHAGQILGTPAYMPPEQAIGAHEQVDARSDVFGLGAILCTILTGRPPYVGESSESTRQLAARARLDDAFAALDRSAAEPEIVSLCKRCLAPEPADRPADAGVVARDVANLRAAATERAQRAEIDRAEAEVKASEERKRRRIWNRSVGAVAAVLAVGAALSAWQAVRASLAERETSHQLELTRDAERKANDGEMKARESEAKAKESAAKANESETKERVARTEAEKQKREAKEQAATAIAVKDFVCEILAGIEPKKKATPQEIEEHRRATRKQLDYAVSRLDEFGGDPAIEAMIRNTIGMMYDTIGALEPAERQLKGSLGLLDRVLGPKNVTTITAANALAGFYMSHDRPTDAKPLFERCLDAFEKDIGLGSTLAMHACRHLILIAQSQKRYDEAIPYHERSRAISERTFGKDSDDELDRRLDLGRGYQLNSQYAEAEREFRAVVDIASVKHGVDKAITTLAWMDLQQCYSKQSKHQMAEQSLIEEVDGKIQSLGPNHSRTRDAKRRLAYHYSQQKKYGKSIRIFQELLRISDTDAAGSCSLLLHMGNDYLSAGQPGEAVRVLEAAEEIRRKRKNLDSYRDFSHACLDAAYAAIHRPDKIAALGKDRIEELRPALAPQGEELGNELAIQGKKLLGLRQYDESEAMLRESLSIREKRDPNHWRTHNARSLLGGALSGLGQHEKAESLLIRGYEGLKATQDALPGNGRTNLPEAADRIVLHFSRLNRAEEIARWRTEREKYPRESAPPPREVK